LKPTKMRNKQIYYATSKVKSVQTASPLSNDLRKKFGKRSARIIKGDTVKILRGEFYGTAGKVTKIITQKNSITVDGVKREKVKGEKIDVPIHATNVIITALNDDDKWRMNKLQGKSKDTLKKIKQEEAEARTKNKQTEESQPKTKKDVSKEEKEMDVKK
tara:strand:- start:380 stop:859 length:480 start_codon:yes stop_codon:yes gene_type:complete